MIANCTRARRRRFLPPFCARLYAPRAITRFGAPLENEKVLSLSTGLRVRLRERGLVIALFWVRAGLGVFRWKRRRFACDLWCFDEVDGV